MASQYVSLPLEGGGGAGVSSLNSLTGALSIVAGSGITVTPSGTSITIAATGGGGSGTVTTISVVSANGLAGTVSNPTTTPAITLSTSITGILKGNGTAISAASAGTDYVIPSGSITGTASNITASSNSTLTTLSSLSLPYSQVTGGPSGSVTSVALADSTGIFNISGSPVTTSGTLSLASLKSQAQNTFLAAPNGSSGAPTFRTIAVADVPTLNQNTTGTAANVTATSNSTLVTLSALSLPYSQITGAPAAITALTNDVVASGPGSVAATIQPNVVTNAKLAQMAANTIKGNNTGGTANAVDLTESQVAAMQSAYVGARIAYGI